MKLLKIEDNRGFYRTSDGQFKEVDEMTKESLLWIIERILDTTVELDEYDDEALKNQAHQVIYRSVFNNLKALLDRRDEFKDDAERLFLEDYKRYVGEISEKDEEAISDSSPVEPDHAGKS